MSKLGSLPKYQENIFRIQLSGPYKSGTSLPAHLLRKARPKGVP